MKTFRQFVAEKNDQKKNDQKRIAKEIKKKQKASNAKVAAIRVLYKKLGYKGNPGDYDLDEGVIWDSAKEVAKDNAKYVVPAIVLPGGIPALAVKAGAELVGKIKNKKKSLASN